MGEGGEWWGGDRREVWDRGCEVDERGVKNGGERERKVRGRKGKDDKRRVGLTALFSPVRLGLIVEIRDIDRQVFHFIP